MNKDRLIISTTVIVASGFLLVPLISVVGLINNSKSVVLPTRESVNDRASDIPIEIPTFEPSHAELPNGCYEVSTQALSVIAGELKEGNVLSTGPFYAVEVPAREEYGIDLITEEPEYLEFGKWGVKYIALVEYEVKWATNRAVIGLDDLFDPKVIVPQALESYDWKVGDQERPEDQFGIPIKGSLWELQFTMTATAAHRPLLNCVWEMG